MDDEEFIEHCYQKAIGREEDLTEEEGKRIGHLFASLPKGSRLWEKAGAASYNYERRAPGHDPWHYYSETPDLYCSEWHKLHDK